MKTELKMVKLAQIIPLMQSNESKISYFINSIEKNKAVRNPVALASVDHQKYFLLESSDLLKAAAKMDLEYIPAQVVPFSNKIGLSGEIFVENMEKTLLAEFHSLFPRAFIMSTDDTSGAGFNDGTMLSIDMENHSVMIISFRKSGGQEISNSYFDFFTYLGSRKKLSNRLFSDNSPTENVRKRSENCFIKAINLTHKDIETVAQRGYLFPNGFLTFDFGPRILGIDYPINVLKACASIEEKEQFLHELFNLRLNTGCSEFITGGIYLLNY